MSPALSICFLTSACAGSLQESSEEESERERGSGEESSSEEESEDEEQTGGWHRCSGCRRCI